jgi:2-polyprenyl-3-methyl-5-hydroxy-6-metoxy-1,4-benzoquinol methylase
MTENRVNDPAECKYTERRIAHWDAVAEKCGEKGPSTGLGYHARLASVHTFLIPPGQKVLEVGCGAGNLLASLKPSVGVGVDFSAKMVDEAASRHPELQFKHLDAHSVASLDTTFDVIVLSDLVNDLWDVQRVLESVATLCTPETRVVLNFYSKLWQPILSVARRMGFATPVLEQNWLTPDDVVNMMTLSGFDVLNHRKEILLPARIPLLEPLCNRFLVKLWPFTQCALTHVFSARLAPKAPSGDAPRVSVIVAARNESGNIENIFERVPQMGGGTELIFVDGGSSDDTYAQIERTMPKFPHIDCKLMRQPGKGKGDAVRKGFSEATGDILMILDADLTVPPEDLPRFYDALVSGKAEFVNGVRLVYPMEEEAMRFFNQIGNKFFSLAFSWLLGRPIKDTLCGTKVLTKANYEKVAANRHYFGDFDPFGDFDLIFGAAKLNLKIMDLPVRYRERTYGDTNIDRWSAGVVLLRMVVFAARRIKFV